jgi:glutamyl-tRNA reductase
MTKKKGEALRALYEEIADNILDAPDAEVVEEFKGEAESVEQASHHVRGVLRNAWKGFQQRSLREAQSNYQQAAVALKSKMIRLPATPAARRELFNGVLAARRQDVGHTIHMQFRDFGEMSDEDVETCLQQFAQLGLLDDDGKTND